MPFSNLSWLTDWWRDFWHWASQWVMFCPVLTLATSRTREEKDEAQSRFLTKFLVASLLYISNGVISVSVGSWLTLKIVEYRVGQLEESAKASTKKHFDIDERVGRDEREAGERFGRVESRVSVIEERHRLEERPKR